MTMTVYHMPMSRSNRVLWLMEELGLPYEAKKVDFAAIQGAEYKANVHPLGRVPAVVLDDGSTMFESGAILNYLLETNDNDLRPKAGDADHTAYLQWFDFAEATLVVPIGNVMQHSFIKPEDQRIPGLVVQSAAAAKEALAVIDKEMAGRDWIAGDRFTAADIMTIYSVALAQMAQLWSADEFPNLGAYFARATARPAYEAMTKA
ncbi:MAG: glutathione S-transferase family protein [Alphaproteobacteria bacterium]